MTLFYQKNGINLPALNLTEAWKSVSSRTGGRMHPFVLWVKHRHRPHGRSVTLLTYRVTTLWPCLAGLPRSSWLAGVISSSQLLALRTTDWTGRQLLGTAGTPTAVASPTQSIGVTSRRKKENTYIKYTHTHRSITRVSASSCHYYRQIVSDSSSRQTKASLGQTLVKKMGTFLLFPSIYLVKNWSSISEKYREPCALSVLIGIIQ